MIKRSSFTVLVSTLVLLLLLVTLGATSVLADERDLIDEVEVTYAPTHTQLHHQLIGIHDTWVFWMTDRLRVAAPNPWGAVETQLWLEDTEACAASVDLEVLSTRLIVSDSPFSDQWLALTVVSILLEACDRYNVAKDKDAAAR